ncbi:MAG: DUF4340 domain-containing protein [Phycisphaerales bacterium]
MSFRWRGIIAFGIAAVLGFTATRLPEGVAEVRTQRSALVAADAVDPERIATVVLERDGVRYRFEQRAGNWQQVEPIPHAIDGWSMRQLIGRVLKAESVRSVELPAEESARGPLLAEAGLAPPAGSIELIEESDGASPARTVRIDLGRRSLAGRAYARLATAGDRYEVIDASLHEYALGRDPKEFRRRDIFIDLGEVDRLAFRSGSNEIVLVRDGRRYRLEAPVRTRADRAQVEELVDALRRAKSGGFVSDRPVEPSVYGLDPAMATLEVDSAGTRRTLLIGDAVSIGAQDRFGILDGTSTVVRLPAAVLAPMVPRVDRMIDAVATGVRARDVASIEIAPSDAPSTVGASAWISLRRETDGWTAGVAESREAEPRRGVVDAERVEGLLKSLTEARASAVELGELPSDSLVATVTLIGFAGEPLDTVRIARRASDGRFLLENGDRVLRVHGEIDLPLTALDLGFRASAG